jgi:hypothetical protein
MIKRRILVSMLLLLSSGALADDFVGQASVVDGDTLEIPALGYRRARRQPALPRRGQFAIPLWRAGRKRP